MCAHGEGEIEDGGEATADEPVPSPAPLPDGEIAAAEEQEGRLEGPQDSAEVLDQHQIDALLGIGPESDESKPRQGIQSIINSDQICYERLPLLEVIFDRLVRLLTTSLRNLTSDTVEVTLSAISSVRFGDFLNSIPFPALLGVFHSTELDSHGLATVDSSLIYSIVDVLLGGRRGSIPMRIEGRPYTTIERELVQGLMVTVFNDMASAFEPVCKTKFELDRLEVNPRFAAIARPANAIVLAKLHVEMEGRSGHIEIALPYAMLEPIREVLLQSFMGEKFGRDAYWEAHLASELWHTNIELNVVLDELRMPLRDAMRFEVGQTLILNVGPHSEVEIRSGGVKLMTGKLGRLGHRVAIAIERPVGAPKRR
jgi:flagellar motor switch protein FliM